MISLYGAVVAHEWALRAGIGWLIEHQRQPSIALRFLNAFFETSIPTVMLFMAVSFLGLRDALGSPAFLLYFFFIVLSLRMVQDRDRAVRIFVQSRRKSLKSCFISRSSSAANCATSA